MVVNYNDPTHITTDGDFITVAEWIRTKMYGSDIREALAQAVLRAGESVKANEDLADDFRKLIKQAKDDYDAARKEMTDQWDAYKDDLAGLKTAVPELKQDVSELEARADMIDEKLPDISELDASIQDAAVKAQIVAIVDEEVAV